MRYFIYSLRRFTDPNQPLAPAETWAKRKQKIISSAVIDFSPRQKRRDRLISMAKFGDWIITPSLHNFASSPNDMVKVLVRLDERGIGLVLLKERQEIKPGSIRMRTLRAFCDLLQQLSRDEKRETRIKSSYLTQLLGTKVGREPLPSEQRREVIRLLHEENLSLAEAAKRVGISKSSAHRASKGKN